MAFILQDPYPVVELAPPPRARPIIEPRLVSVTPASTQDEERTPRLQAASSPLDNPDHRKHQKSNSDIGQVKRESFNLTGSTYLITDAGKTLKLPIPSDSASDPLNWSRWKTARAIFAISVYSIVCLTAAQAPAVILEEIQNDAQVYNNVPNWLIKALVTAPTFWMGVGCFLWVPLSIGMGRRPTILIATLVVLFAMFWAGNATSFHSLVGAVSFVGLGEGLSLSLVFLMLIDLTYINQRPKAIALMWCVAGCFGTSGVALVPILSTHGHHWRRFYHLGTLPVIVSFIITFLLYPETYFKRPTVAFDGLIVLQSATEKLTVYRDIEKDSDLYRDLPDHPVRTGFAGFRDRVGLARSPFASWKSMGRCYIQIGYCAVNPLIFWVFVASAFNSASMIFIGATYARILIASPYKMSPSIVGTVNVASGVGALFGIPAWSLISLKVKQVSKRNRGILEAENYLIGYIVPVIVGSLSSLLYGLTVSHKWHFSAIYISYGLNGFSFVTLMIANTIWVTEAFPRWAAPALTVVGGGSYLLSFAMSFALVPWIEAHGYKWVGIELTVFQILGGLVAMPVAFWGKNARQAIQGRWAEDASGALRPL